MKQKITTYTTAASATMYIEYECSNCANQVLLEEDIYCQESDSVDGWNNSNGKPNSVTARISSKAAQGVAKKIKTINKKMNDYKGKSNFISNRKCPKCSYEQRWINKIRFDQYGDFIALLIVSLGFTWGAFAYYESEGFTFWLVLIALIGLYGTVRLLIVLYYYLSFLLSNEKNFSLKVRFDDIQSCKVRKKDKSSLFN